MLPNRKISLSITFFTIVIIASCITFNNQKNIDNYDYDTVLPITDVNFWGQPLLIAHENKSDTKRVLSALFEKNKLQYIVSNDYAHTKRYKYVAINDTTHILVRQRNRTPFLARADVDLDSIIFTQSCCIIKSLNYRHHMTGDTYGYIHYYIKQKDSIVHYTYEQEKSFSPNINTLPLLTILSHFITDYNTIAEPNSKVLEKFPVSTATSFFREKIMEYKFEKSSFIK